jgi:plasmid stabilization system protein ParE
MKLRFTRRAAQDLADYIRKQNPQAALRVRAAILESLQNLVLFPQVGRHQNSYFPTIRRWGDPAVSLARASSSSP